VKPTEAQIQRAFAEILRELGFDVREEVGYAGKRFDVVARLNSNLFGFEIKLHDWRRALRQLRAYQLCCDRAFLVKFGGASDELIRECVSAGVGLYVVDAQNGKARRLAGSRRSLSWSRHYATNLMRAFFPGAS
jgi:hypothetical protein